MNYYTINFTLMWDFKKDPFPWDDLIPFERQIYLDMILNRLQENKNNKSQQYIPTEAEYKASPHGQTNS